MSNDHYIEMVVKHLQQDFTWYAVLNDASFAAVLSQKILPSMRLSDTTIFRDLPSAN